MTRHPNVVALVLALCSAFALGACSSKPNTPDGNPVLPNGVSLAKSDLPQETDPKLSESDATSFGASNRALAFELYGELAKKPGNLFISPYSISVALAMAYAGANGTTETEMRAALHFDLDEPTLHEAFNATGLTLMGRKDEIGNDAPGNPGDPGNKGDGFQLSMVNQAWGQKGHAFLDGYLDVLAVHYGAGLFLLDFGDTEAARTTINGWVQDQTHDRIKDLLPEGSIHSDTPLVLTNAIYFKASWQQKFDPAKTADATFTAPDGTRSVPMMHETTDGQYAAGADYQAVSLPYLSKDVRMLVVLPADGSFDTTVAHFDEAFFQKVVTGLGRYQVTLSMPKFSFESSSGLKPALQALGMNAAFADGADFSGLDGTHNLYIEDVLHKAFVAVDEQGTEAAAATAVIFGEVSLPPSAELTLNRPFIFAIYDEPTGQVLFLGHLVDPG